MRSPVPPPALALGWLVAAAAAVALLRLTEGPSRALYLAVAERTAGLPALEVLAEGGVLVLVAWWAVVALRARANGPVAVATALVGGVGAVLAYAASEVTKSVVRQPRGCWELVEAAHCPPAGDWSYPSNHTAIAFALATSVVLTTHATGVRSLGYDAPPRHALLGRPEGPVAFVLLVGPFAVAAIVAATRVAQGVHFPHDVTAGAVVGVSVVGALVVGAVGPATAAVHAMCRVAPLRQVLLARPH